nr:MAG TPA: hypothetical protein [Caudoviricetes sp.]
MTDFTALRKTTIIHLFQIIKNDRIRPLLRWISQNR